MDSEELDYEPDVLLGGDAPHTFWDCERCGARNSCLDGECQFCEPECAGHPASEFGLMGRTAYCDGSCRRAVPS